MPTWERAESKERRKKKQITRHHTQRREKTRTRKKNMLWRKDGSKTHWCKKKAKESKEYLEKCFVSNSFSFIAKIAKTSLWVVVLLINILVLKINLFNEYFVNLILKFFINCFHACAFLHEIIRTIGASLPSLNLIDIFHMIWSITFPCNFTSVMSRI